MSLGPRPINLPRKIAAKWWAWRKTPGKFHVKKPASFWVWRKWRASHARPKPVPKPSKMFMFDDVNVSLIPKNAEAVAGYVDGHFQTWAKVAAGWPKAKKLRIAVFGQDNGDCLDVEPGDASIMQAPGWVKRQIANWHKSPHDVARPVVYTSASQLQKLVVTMTKAGLRFGQDYLVWSAHYDPKRGAHLCSPTCGFGIKVTAHATQYTDHADGVSLDESLCGPDFFK